jgi:DNA-binding GntR family transcriptional regulator
MTSATPVLTVAEQIATRLRSELLSGRYPPGEPLREERLAERFGVSRHPIRKVLQQLAGEGLLVAKRNCGVTVAPPPPDAVRELLMPMRVMVETYALRACFDRLGADDFQQFEQLLGRLRLACEEGDYTATLERDFDFHRAIVERAGQADLLPVWTLLIARTQPFYEHTQIPRAELAVVHVIHVALLDTFRRGDEDVAVEALSQHILNAKGSFNDRIKRRWAEEKRRRRA